MAAQKLGFEDFISTVDGESSAFVRELHGLFMEHGCKLEVKEAKSGYVVSYLLDKKAVMNYVFRKKGLLVRIYANNVGGYLDVLETLPRGMIDTLRAAPDCKRLTGSADCSSRCVMGCDIILDGERYQKCRYNAFLFVVCGENNPSIRTLLARELALRAQAH